MVGIVLLSRFPKGHPLCELDAHYLLIQEGWAGLIKGTVWRLVRVAVDAPFDLGGAVRSSMVSDGALPTTFLVATKLLPVSEPEALEASHETGNVYSHSDETDLDFAERIHLVESQDYVVCRDRGAGSPGFVPARRPHNLTGPRRCRRR